MSDRLGQGATVLRVEKLPRRYTSEGGYVLHGYVASISRGWTGPIIAGAGHFDGSEDEQPAPVGPRNQLWFFEHPEPALAFGRAARSSVGGCSGYGVMRAAMRVKYDDSIGHDRLTLYLLANSNGLDRADGERESLQRWIDGVRPDLNEWAPPGGAR